MGAHISSLFGLDKGLKKQKKAQAAALKQSQMAQLAQTQAMNKERKRIAKIKAQEQMVSNSTKGGMIARTKFGSG